MVLETKKKYGFFGEKFFKIKDYTPLANSILTKEELMKPEYKSRILQMDGGGILGTIPLYQLYVMESNGIMIQNTFDTYWGTSTGAIMTSLLVYGWSAKQLLTYYIEQGPLIFQENVLWGGLTGSLYNATYIQNLLTKTFGKTTFKELYDQTGKELNICVVNVTDETYEIWNYKDTPDYEVWAGVRASMSAPIYFEPFNYRGKVYVDGGTGGQNCLAEKAYNDAFYTKKIPANNFFILSMGCGEGMVGTPGNDKLEKALWVFQYARTESTYQQMQFLKYRHIDNGLSYLRYNLPLPKDLSSMDKTDNIADLVALVDKK